MSGRRAVEKEKIIEFITGSKELLKLVEPLWERLNTYHRDKSIYFKERFEKFNGVQILC